VAFDWRGHGNSMELECNLDVLILSEDVMRVVEYIVSSFKESNVIIVGHSMGGSLAVKSLNFILENAGHNIINRLMAIIVIDVVEGTAMDALPFME
jgi:protein phosphatase methylesterase 1